MDHNYINLFKNHLISHTLKDSESSHRNYSMMDKCLELLDGVEPDKQYELMLKIVKDFRMKNLHMYEFEYTCPICYETSTDSKFLIKMTECDHKCCLQCWKDQIQYQHLNSKDTSHCFKCDKKVSIDNIIKFNLLTDRQQIIQCYRVYDNKYHNLYECGKCGSKFTTDNKICAECPDCFHVMCLKCMSYFHQNLEMNCSEFEVFMKSDKYIKFIDKREKERQIKLIEVKYKDKTKNLFKKLEFELILAVETREKRLTELERQKRLREENEKTMKWISENTKKCPNCLVLIEKNKGCNHMTCKRCLYEFCWYCLEECTNPSSHFKQCKAGAKWFDDGYVD